MRIIFLIITLFSLISCANLLPQIKFKLKNIKGINLYTIRYICTGKDDKKVVICKGGIKGGSIYCDKPAYLRCDKDNKFVIYGFDAEGISSIREQLGYYNESYKEVR